HLRGAELQEAVTRATSNGGPEARRDGGIDGICLGGFVQDQRAGRFERERRSAHAILTSSLSSFRSSGSRGKYWWSAAPSSATACSSPSGGRSFGKWASTSVTSPCQYVSPTRA